MVHNSEKTVLAFKYPMTEGVREIQVHDDEDRQSLNGKGTFFFFNHFFLAFLFSLCMLVFDFVCGFCLHLFFSACFVVCLRGFVCFVFCLVFRGWILSK